MQSGPRPAGQDDALPARAFMTATGLATSEGARAALKALNCFSISSPKIESARERYLRPIRSTISGDSRCGIRGNRAKCRAASSSSSRNAPDPGARTPCRVARGEASYSHPVMIVGTNLCVAFSSTRSFIIRRKSNRLGPIARPERRDNFSFSSLTSPWFRRVRKRKAFEYRPADRSSVLPPRPGQKPGKGLESRASGRASSISRRTPVHRGCRFSVDDEDRPPIDLDVVVGLEVAAGALEIAPVICSAEVLLLAQQPVVRFVVPGVIRPSEAVTEIQLLLEHHFDRTFEQLTAIAKPIVPYGKAVDPVLGCNVPLKLERLWIGQAVLAQRGHRAANRVMPRPSRRTSQMGPFGEPFSPPSIVFRNSMKLRQMEREACDQGGSLRAIDFDGSRQFSAQDLGQHTVHANAQCGSARPNADRNLWRVEARIERPRRRRRIGAASAPR